MTPQAAPMPHNMTLPDLALELVQMRGSQDMLQREVSTNIQNLSSSTQALQGDVRHLAQQIGELGRLQERQLSHSEGLERAFASIERLAESFEAYRDRHGIENQLVADKVTDFGGRIKGVWAAGGLFVALATTLCGLAWDQLRTADADLKTEVRQSFSDAKAERIALEARARAHHDEDVARIQAQVDEMRRQAAVSSVTSRAR